MDCRQTIFAVPVGDANEAPSRLLTAGLAAATRPFLTGRE
jgi:hypothetical protein